MEINNLNLHKTIEFIQSNANPVEMARLDYLLYGKQPARTVVSVFTAEQRSDGGWKPFWAEDYTSLDATCFRLAQANQLGFDVKNPCISKALQFLLSRQAQDGSWQEAPHVAEIAPPWARPGEPMARLYLTANVGYWTATLGDHESSRLAGEYLRGYLEKDGRLPSYLHTQWLAVGLWNLTGLAEVAELCLASLGSRLGDLSTDNLAWMLVCLFQAGFTSQHPVLGQALTLLLSRQQPDGRWPSDDSPDIDVHVCLEVLQVIQLSGLAHLPTVKRKGISRRRGGLEA
jgi:hypothetical protein